MGLHNAHMEGCVMCAACFQKPFFGMFLPPCFRLGGRCCRHGLECCGWREAVCSCVEVFMACIAKMLRLVLAPLRCIVLCPLFCLCCCINPRGGEMIKCICTLLCGDTLD